MQRKEHERAFGEARQILRYLLLGVDPETDEPLIEDSANATAEVKAALALGIEELRCSHWIRQWWTGKRLATQPSWQASRAPRPALAGVAGDSTAVRSGVGWSLAEDRQIAQEFAEGQKLTMMATNHQRSRGSILARLVHLGLMKRNN